MPFPSHPTHLCAVREQTSCRPAVSHLPTSLPAAKCQYPHLLFRGVPAITRHWILACFNDCTHFILKVMGLAFLDQTLPQYFHLSHMVTCRGSRDSLKTDTNADSAVQLCSATVIQSFYFAMTNLILISLALDYLVLYNNKRLCSDAKQEKQGMGHPTLIIMVT